MKKHSLPLLAAGFLCSVPTAVADDGKRGDDNRSSDHRHGGRHGHSHRPGFIYPPVFSVGFGYSSPFFSAPYYDPYLVEQNLAILEFQRQQARAETERALKAEADAQAAAAERLAQLKAETRRKRAAIAAKNAARNFAAGNYRIAAANYQEAAGLAVDDASVYYMLAQSQFAMKRFVDAAKSLRTAVRVNPNLVNFDVTAFYKDAEEFRAQLTALADELRVNPLNRDAMLLFGHMLFVSGQKASAKVILMEAAKLGIEAEILKPYFDHYLPPPPAVSAR
jgi:tetratricopeptide (TPR) repeat protein